MHIHRHLCFQRKYSIKNCFNEFLARLSMEISTHTITIARFCIQCVSSSTALQTNASVATNSVITSLCVQAIVIINLAFIYIFETTEKTDFNCPIFWLEFYFKICLPTHAFTTLSIVNPILHSQRNDPGIFTQF